MQRKLHGWLPRLNPSPARNAARRTTLDRPRCGRRSRSCSCSTRSCSLIKIVVGVRTGALTVLGAALESGLDMLNNVIGIALVARRQPRARRGSPLRTRQVRDARRARHRRVPVDLVLRAAARRRGSRCWRAGHRITSSLVDIGFIVGTLVVNVFVVWYERRRGRELGSVVSHGRRRAHRRATSSSRSWRSARWRSRGSAGRVSTPRSRSAVALIIAWSGVQILRESIPVLVDERAIEAQPS